MNRFTAPQRALLLATARLALVNCLVHGQSPRTAAQAAVAAAKAENASQADLPPAGAENDPLLADAACFVTLWQGNHDVLRGCRGEFNAHQPLLAAVAQMALAAALDDPRFEPLTPTELPQVCIEISVLTPLTPIKPQDVELGRHGLLIAQGNRRGLLLPEVPIEHHMSRAAYLAALCAKAGLADGAWRDPSASLWAFETEAWEEDS